MSEPFQVAEIRLAGPAEQLRWDAYVRTHGQASPYHLFAWRLAVEEAYGHRCFSLYAERGGRMVGVLPLVRIRLPGLIDELTGLPYCDVGGCLSDDQDVQDALLAHALQLRQALGCRTINLRGPLLESELVRSRLFAVETGKVRMFLDLPGSGAELLASFKSKLRNKIGRSERLGVTFRWAEQADLERMYQVFAANMHLLGSPVHAMSWLAAVLRHYGPQARAGLTEYEGQTIGMGIILMNGQTVAIPWSSTLRRFNHLAPNMLLYWNCLKFSADQGFSRFDFGRSTQDEGTYQFKKQWGAEPRPLLWYTDQAPALHAASRPAGRGKRLVAAVWQRLPLAVANRFGPRLRKFISL